MPAKQTPENFWARVDVRDMDECWPWTGSTNSTGYGTVAWDGRLYVAHRVAAWLVGRVESPSAPDRASIPGHVLHTCDVRRCCNPMHFFLGTFTDNMLDAYAKGRKVQPKGQHHTNSKLSNAQAATIRTIYARGGARQVDLADLYGVSQRAVSLIVTGKTYQWI